MRSIRHAPAADLSRFLEHDGDVNDEELGGTPGAYLQMLRAAGVLASETDPVILGVFEDEDGWRACITDGNHRLILALEGDPAGLVPYVIDRDPDCLHPGFPYDGSLG